MKKAPEREAFFESIGTQILFVFRRVWYYTRLWYPAISSWTALVLHLLQLVFVQRQLFPVNGNSVVPWAQLPVALSRFCSCFCKATFNYGLRFTGNFLNSKESLSAKTHFQTDGIISIIINVPFG